MEWLELQGSELLTVTQLPERPIATFLLAGSNAALLIGNGELLA